MHRLRYESGTGGEAVELDERRLSAGTATGLRGREWDYVLGPRGISQVQRRAREVTVTVTSTDPEGRDRARRIMDRDVQAGTPGELVFDGEWRTRAFAVRSEPSLLFRRLSVADLTLVLVDGIWRRATTASYLPAASVGGDWLNYPHDYPMNYMATPAPQTVEGSAWAESPLRLTIFGPAVNPVVTIAGNRYAYDGTVAAGARVVIDGLAKTVTEISVTGDEVNRFSSARRGGGLGSGEYCFQPLPPGVSSLAWPGTFGFDLTRWDEESEPPCTSS